MTDRLNKALKESGLSVAEAAEYFDVHRNTVSGWLHGRIKPDTRTLKLWAFMTGVPLQWILTGDIPPAGPDGGGVEPPAGIEPATYSLRGHRNAAKRLPLLPAEIAA